MVKRGDRKGNAIVQLSWIAVFLVGIFLVIFFMGFSSKQGQLTEKITTAKISSNLNSIFSSIKAGNNLYDKISLPEKTDITFDCEAASFSIKDQQYTYPKNSIIFAHHIIAPDLMLISKDWDKPFFVTNFLYFASSQEYYLMVYSNDIYAYVQNFYNELPEELNKDVILYPKLYTASDKGYPKMVIAFFSPHVSNSNIPANLKSLPSSFSGKDITAVEFILDEKKVRFFDKKDNAWQASSEMDYYDNETMLGALFSGSSSDYDCSMTHALQSLKNAAQDVQVKIAALEQARPDCSYSAITEKLQSLPTDTTGLNAVMGDIKEDNNNLEMKSCPLIY